MPASATTPTTWPFQLHLLERGLERLKVGVTSDETSEATAARHVEPRQMLASTRELEDLDRLADTLHSRGAKVPQVDVSRDERRCRLAHADRVRRSHSLHPLREPHGEALRRVVHTQIVADAADDHLAAVDADAHREVEPPGEA